MAISNSTTTTTITQAAMVSASPPVTADALLSISPEDQAKLKDVYDLLDKLFVRNINQHRRSHWWKSLHAFRKQLRMLLGEMEAKRGRTSMLEARLRYWDESCIHQWYL